MVYIFHVDANSAFLSWSTAYRVNILEDRTDLCKVASIVGGDQEKTWAVFDGFESLYGRGQMVAFAYRLKDEIRTGLGFTVNIGISTNFLLAKTASVFRK